MGEDHGEGPVKTAKLLLLTDRDGRVLLERRPPAGVWGGLWCFPQCDSNDEISDWARAHLGLRIKPRASLPVVQHTFSHYRLEITPVPATLAQVYDRVMESGEQLWYKPELENEIGLAAPVRKLTSLLFGHSNQ